MPRSRHPYHHANLGGAESVMQMGDVVRTSERRRLCPFEIGGDMTIGLEASFPQLMGRLA